MSFLEKTSTVLAKSSALIERVVSSANKQQCMSTVYTKSLIKIRNKSEPKTELCGTPILQIYETG